MLGSLAKTIISVCRYGVNFVNASTQGFGQVTIVLLYGRGLSNEFCGCELV